MSSIQQFYEKQTIFLTGATGSIGKLILEKLLRTCFNINKIYVVVRPKYHKSQEERFRSLFEQPCFDLLKTVHPDFRKKVHLINGDCSRPLLDLNEDTLSDLRREVTCVIHVAANVKFDTDLKTAVYTNVRSVRDLLHLAKDMEKLGAFVYVSTAFSHCHRREIDEEFYPVDVEAEKLLKMVDVMDDKTLDLVTPFILGQWPNTYVFTKAVAEDVIRNYKQVLPVTIVRPAIVTSTSESPIVGWVDNFHGVVGVVTGVSMGLLRCLQIEKKFTARIVPADYVVNNVLAAAWDISNSEKGDEDIPIYNFSGCKENSISWAQLNEEFMKYSFKYPLNSAVWYYVFKRTKYRFLHRIHVFFLHTLFAYFIDFMLFLVGKRPIAVEKYKKIDKLTQVLSYFATRSWNFHNKNVDKLWEKMNEEDRKMFNFDMRNLSWEKYIEGCAVGGRIYLMKDPLETLPQAKRKIYILAIIHYSFIVFMLYLLYKVSMPLFALLL